MKLKKKDFLKSGLALLLCISVFIGTTFAWFTDSVTSGTNIIQSGNLDIEMYWTDDLNSGTWYSVEDANHNTIFSYDNWEPGYTDVKYIKLKNNGSLALNYNLSITPENGVGKLAEVINVYYANSKEGIEVASRDELNKLSAMGLLSSVMNGGETVDGTLLAANQQSPVHDSGETIITLAMSMITTAGNEYQKEDAGEFTITALATQAPFESDSFGSDYDSNATLPGILASDKATVAVTPVDGKVPTGGATLQGEKVSAFVPAGAQMKDGADKLTLSVTPLEKTTSDITTVNNEILIPVDVHIEGIDESNTTPIIIDLGEILPKYLNMGNYFLFHIEDGQNKLMTLVDSKSELTAHNTFTYNPTTGEVSVAMASFSEVALFADTAAKWEGGEDYNWYDASKTSFEIANADQLYAFAKIVGGMAISNAQDSFNGKTVKLLSNINLNYGTVLPEGEEFTKIFYPIGYYNNDDKDKYDNKTGIAITSGFKTFEGTFDGDGHTISNIYQNTWQMKGDHDWYAPEDQHYRDGMGLFGRVNGGTVKNLTVDNFKSDGEITTTGVIAAYADFGATFENIAITNCNPRVYNIGNGGIVGCVGWYTKAVTDKKVTFKNITVDVTNKISALWGSYDVACGGIVGQYYPTSGQSSANYPKNPGISFENCHVSAVMDVYNDVCANYQYYAYRYAGMMIGSIRENETINGRVYPKMDGITATGCTVHYDTWNDYFYCELVANSIASYTHDHQFSRLERVAKVEGKTITPLDGDPFTVPTLGRYNYVVTKEGVEFATENATCYHFVDGEIWNHEDAGYEDFDLDGNGKLDDLKEDHYHIYLPFAQLFTGYGWGVTSKGISDYEGVSTMDITSTEQKDSAIKFENNFSNDSFIYRVGNENAVALGTLFKAADGQTINNQSVHVTFNKLSDDMNVSATYNADKSDWTKGTIKFNGTGVIKVTIQDYNFCTPTVLFLEVVDAYNATSATNATSKDIVLLKNCGFSSLEVSGGHTLYGNGFTLTCGSDATVLDLGYSFVTLNNGTLDNVQIICPNFDYAALYKTNLDDSGNRSETTDKKRYYNAKSGVMASGNSQILNSRISGGRASLNVSSGNIVVDNSRIELGAVASILVGAANSLTLRDVTLVQKPAVSTYDKNKTLMGFSVLYLCDSEGKATPTTLEGKLVQQAWVNEDDKQYVPSAGQSIVDGVMNETAFLHNINGKDSLNLGFAYMPEDAQKTVAKPDNITDNRTDKATVPYEMKDVSIRLAIVSTTVYVYSYKNSNGTADSFKNVANYVPSKQSDIIKLTYSDTSDGLETGKSYGADGWIYELNVDLDKLSGYAFDFSKMTMSVNGTTVTDFKVNGNAKPTSPIVVTAGGTTYKLTATVNGKEYTAYYKVTGTETSKDSPTLVASNYAEGICVASKKGGTWSGAAPALQGIQIRYWSVAEQQYKTINLADYTPTTKGKLNGSNTTWTYSPANGDFTLTLTGGQVHSSNKVNAIPVCVDTDNNGTADTLYFVAASSNGLVNTGNGARTIPVSYTFKDNNNGDTLTFSHTWSVAENQDAEYGYDDLCNGTLTKLESGSSGGGCVTADTLITLADGTQKRVDELKGDELLLVWNIKTGKYEAAPMVFVDFENEADCEIVHLYFSDGTDVKVIYEHGFFDLDLGKYVYIDATNYADYIGHRFIKQGDIEANTWNIITLDEVVIEKSKATAWSPVTFEYLCYYTNGVLSMPGGIEGLFNIFEVDTDAMCYDTQKMEKDIAEYGLFTLEDFGGMITQDAFDAFNGAYLKVAMGKGLLTWEDIAYMAERYIPLM